MYHRSAISRKSRTLAKGDPHSGGVLSAGWRRGPVGVVTREDRKTEHYDWFWVIFIVPLDRPATTRLHQFPLGTCIYQINIVNKLHENTVPKVREQVQACKFLMKYFADCSWGEEGGTVRGCSLGRPNMGGGTSHPVREAITWGDSSKFQEPRSNQNNSQSLNLINFNLFILQNRRLHLKHYSKPGIVMTINRSTGEVLWRMKAKPDCTGSPKHKVVVSPVPTKIKIRI